MSNTILNKHPYVDVFTYFFESDLAPSASVPMYFSGTPPDGQPYIYFNTEQLSRKYALNKLIREIVDKQPVEIWDYSETNVEILKQCGFLAKHIKIQSPTWYIERVKMWIAPEYDVGFCGSLSQRRTHILDEIKKAGISVHIVNQWGDVRDSELAKCRSIVNIHYANDYQIFEIARCEPWLSLGIPVVSETSLDNDERCINVAYDKIVDELVKMLRLKI
jgi:hypothetical protein